MNSNKAQTTGAETAMINKAVLEILRAFFSPTVEGIFLGHSSLYLGHSFFKFHQPTSINPPIPHLAVLFFHPPTVQIQTTGGHLRLVFKMKERLSLHEYVLNNKRPTNIGRASFRQPSLSKGTSTPR